MTSNERNGGSTAERLRTATPNHWPRLAMAERRQLTVLFVDIVDATSLSEQLDPEDFFAILSAYRDLCDAHIRRYGGYIARTVGDGLLAYFGLPLAHEDDSERAVYAALSIAAAIRDWRFSIPGASPFRVQVRMAANTGTVVVGGTAGESALEEREVFGTPVHVAARLQNIAPADGVVIGPTTYELVRRAFKCTHLGEHEFKGVKHRVEAWLVSGIAETESRFEKTRAHPIGTMVGRGSELATVMTHWSRAEKGTGTVVAISGDAGVGKSRLIREFRASITTAPMETLYLQCSSLHTSIPLAPEIERLRRAAGLQVTDGAVERVLKLRRLLGTAVPNVEEALPYYGALLSIPPCSGFTPANLASPRERERMLLTLADALVTASRGRPVLMIAEDVQWADPTSIELLGRIIPRLAKERILLIMTHRSDYAPEWLAGFDAIQLPLSKLSLAESEQLAGKVAGNRFIAPKMLRRIVERTDGIPLFIEEITQTVLQMLETSAAADNAAPARLKEPLLPATIQDSLTERLDRLGGAKRVLQIASVFGSQFEFSALQFLSKLSRESLEGELRRLEAAGLLREHRSASETLFFFRHVMMQEAAYSLLLKDERRELHSAAASWLKQARSDRDSGYWAVLAYHYARAGTPFAASQAYLSAGMAAIRRSAYKEALANLSEGVAVLEQLSDSPQRTSLEIALQAHIAMAYAALRGWWHPHVDRAYDRALELSRGHGGPRDKSMVLWGIALARLVSAQLPKALEYAEEFLALAGTDEETALMAHTSTLVVKFFLTRFPEARESVAYVLERYDPERHRNLVQIYQHDPKIIALVYGGQMEWLLGHPNRARSYCEEARRLARELAHPFMLAYALIVGSFDHLYDRNHSANLACVEEGLKVAQEHTLPHYEIFGRLWATPAITRQYASGAALQDLSGCLSTLLENKYYLQAPLYQTFLGAEYGRLGEVETARCLLRSAEELMERTGERWFEPEVHRVYADLLHKPPAPDPGAALEYYNRALSSARATGMLGWELRAAISLAEFLLAQDNSDQALASLRDVRGKFAPDEVSADLLEADRLLGTVRQ